MTAEVYILFRFTFLHGIDELIPPQLRDALKGAGYSGIAQVSHFVNEIMSSGTRSEIMILESYQSNAF
jgi:hypothetical protein